MPNKVKPPVVDISKEIKAAQKALKPAVSRLTTALKKLDPKKIAVGALADLLYELRSTASSLNVITVSVTDVVVPAVKLIEEHFINQLPVGESSGVQGYAARVQITSSPIPQVRAEDWEKFFKYVAKTGQWELLTHNLSREAVRERWDAKKQVKFVTTFNKKNVSCTKLGVRKAR